MDAPRFYIYVCVKRALKKLGTGHICKKISYVQEKNDLKGNIHLPKLTRSVHAIQKLSGI